MLSQVDKIIFLKGIPFFASSTMQQLTALGATCVTENYSPDEVIVEVGDVPRALFMVASGNVRINPCRRRPQHRKQPGFPRLFWRSLYL